MSKMHITFDDLCAFFTSKLRDNKLMVGLIQNKASDPDDVHKPIILIREQEQVVERYEGFGEVQGKVFLYVYDMNGSLTDPLIQDKAQLLSGQFPFNSIPDIEDHLYKGQPLTVKADICRARLYFQHGELYAEGETHLFDFLEKETSVLRVDLRLDKVPDKVALDITIPTGGHAALLFENGTRPFTFNDGKDYIVDITNAPPTGEKDSRHFLHFYEIVQNMQFPRLFPIPDPQQVGGEVGPFCVESIFSKADFD